MEAGSHTCVWWWVQFAYWGLQMSGNCCKTLPQQQLRSPKRLILAQWIVIQHRVLDMKCAGWDGVAETSVSFSLSALQISYFCASQMWGNQLQLANCDHLQLTYRDKHSECLTCWAFLSSNSFYRLCTVAWKFFTGWSFEHSYCCVNIAVFPMMKMKLHTQVTKFSFVFPRSL